MRALRCALPLLLLLLLCVSSLPASHTHLEHEDVKVMKCIVEVLADALSKPRSFPVSQQCLETLSTDDRLVTVLRRRNFLQELQDIAGEGDNERSEDHSDDAQHLQDPPDQSMLMAVLSPGESLKGRGAEEEKEQESQENDIITSREDKKEEDDKGEGVVKKKAENSEEEEQEEEVEEADEAGAAGAPEHKRVEEKKQEEEEEEEEQEESRAGMGKQRHWSGIREQVHRRAPEAPHHSKEVWKSPEEEELQMMAGRERDERRDPEEGSADKKTEDAEMESLAVMENELENMAQKLHQLRHG